MKHYPHSRGGRMDKRGGRAAQTFSCHLTLAQLPKIHPSPIHVTSFLWLIFQMSGKADSSFSTKHLCSKQIELKRSMCEGCLREYPPSFPPSPHAYFQTNDLSLSRCVSQLSEGDVRLGVGNTLVCLNCLFPPLFVFFLCYTVRISYLFGSP